ncbi:MAG TPA: metalloregulator ArsR/SmtB family transcription factor [Longimicrobiales bacterium]|nr:metalloregulator ArsR/SmtB family transcription factor [Longimicrobiales bacterium]
MPQAQPTPRETVRVLAALSDENRYRIVELLAAEGDELTCGAIGKALGISPSLLSHHLAILAEAGIVGRRKNGLWTMNALERPVIARQIEVLQRLARTNGKTAGPALAPTEASETRVAAGGA